MITSGPWAGAALSSQCHSPYLIGPSIGRMPRITNGPGSGAGAGWETGAGAGTDGAAAAGAGSSTRIAGAVSCASTAWPAIIAEPSSASAPTVDPPIHFHAPSMRLFMYVFMVNGES